MEQILSFGKMEEIKERGAHFVIACITRMRKDNQDSVEGMQVPLDVQLTVNGVTMPFFETLDNIYKRFEAQANESAQSKINLMEFNKTEEALQQKAKELAKDMLYKMVDKLDWDEE